MMVIAPSAGSLLAQEEAAPQGLNPDSFYGRDPSHGVFVRDSASALERFAHARRMERLEEWNTAAEVYQEIMERYPDRVVPSQVDEQNNIYQYTSVMPAVQERLSSWPAEGLRVYRARYEPIAAEMLDQAGWDDVAELNQVYSLYFVTESGRAAGIRLLDLYLEAGEFPAAGWVGDHLLKRHPTLADREAAILFRTALAYHLNGDRSAAEQRLARLAERHPDARGTVGGQEVVLADSLESLLQTPAPVAQERSADSWPTFGGAPDRGRISAAIGRPGARLGSVELAQPRYPGETAQQREELQRQAERDRQAGLTLGVMPVIDRGELFFQDNARIYAVSLDSGFPLPGWARTHGGRNNGQFNLFNAWSMPRSQQSTLTVTEDSVLAVMGQTDPTAVMGLGGRMPHQPETRLVSLDRRTGQERWIVAPGDLPENPAALRSLSLSGAPLVVGEKVYIIGRGGAGAQFEDSYILCFDLASGEYLWSCYIASASTGNPMWRGEIGLAAENTSHLAYAGGRIYIMTNLGAVAAVDAYRGTILWLSLYPRDQVEMDPRMIRRHPRWGHGRFGPDGLRPWTYDPIVVQDGHLFAFPTDGDYLLIYDAGSGVEIQRIARSHIEEADTLLGVAGERLIVAGQQRVVCLDWRQYDAEAFENNDRDAIVWASSDLPAIRGRGFVTTDSVFVPTEERLYRIDLEAGRVQEHYPAWPRTWGDDEGPGNVLVAEDHVIIAGSRRVDIYTDMARARAKLDEQVADAPDDPEPRLRYAEVMFVAGELPVAMEKLDEAVELLGGLESMRSGEVRDHIFSQSLTFARKLAGDEDPATQPLAEAFFDRAEAAAESAGQKVDYRLNRARFAETGRHFDAAIELYQGMLEDPAMRGVMLADEEHRRPMRAAELAEQSIAEIIRRHGAHWYEPYEQQARADLRQAEAENAPQAFLAIAESYPNARLAPQAMLAAADAFEADGDPRSASHVLRQSYFRYPDSPETARILEAMARNYLAMPNRIEVAIARLDQGAKLGEDLKLQQPLTLPDGRRLEDVTFSEALDELRAYHQQATSPNLPSFQLPGPQERRRPFAAEPGPVIGDVAAILEPLEAYARHDRIVLWQTDERVAVYQVGGTTPDLISDALADEPRNIAWLEENLLIWSDREVALVEGGGGELLWRIELEALPEMELIIGDAIVRREDAEAEQRNGHEVIRLEEGREVAAVRNRQQNVAIRDGEIEVIIRRQAGRNAEPQVVWQAGVLQQMGQEEQQADEVDADERITHVQPLEERIILATSTGRIVAVDLTDGTVAWQNQMEADRPFQRLLARGDFVVVSYRNRDNHHEMAAMDAYNGQVVNRRDFSTTAGLVPVNMALAADGTLVYTMPDRLCGKDLYVPGDELTFEVPRDAVFGSPAFLGASEPDQLLIDNGRIITVEQQGRFVSIHSLRTGRMLRHASNGREVDSLLNTTERLDAASDVRLSIVGPYLYVIGQRSLMAYNLDRIAHDSWTGTLDAAGETNIRRAFAGVEYLVLLDDRSAGESLQARARAEIPRTVHLHAYWRGMVMDRQSGEEKQSGLMVYSEPVHHPAGIVQWQAVDGGFYYLSGDHELTLLRGAGG